MKNYDGSMNEVLIQNKILTDRIIVLEEENKLLKGKLKIYKELTKHMIGKDKCHINYIQKNL